MSVYIEECRLSNGLVLHSDSRTPLPELYREIYRAQIYTPADFPQVKGNDVIVDLGANIGVFALYVAKISPAVKVHAFEPVSFSFKLLQQNVHANNLTNVHCYRYSVSAATGKGLLYVTTAGSTVDTMISSRVPDQGIMQAEEVDCLSLDDLFLNYGIVRCNLLKVDVEGSEFNIFSTVSIDTLRKIDSIALEYHESKSGEGSELQALLQAKGFRVRRIPEPASNRGMIYAVSRQEILT